MKNLLIILISGLVLPLAAQELSPEVLLLSRVKRQVREDLKRLSNVSCLETVFREHQARNEKMKALDEVRLEILTNGTKELYASPGDRRFSENPPIDWVGSGALGNGFFGLYLNTVFLSGNITYAWKGEEEIGGRRLARWDYRLPLMSSGQTFVLEDGSGTVSLHGSFQADPKTDSLVRLEVAAGDFPPTLPLSEAEWSIDYAETELAGNVTVLLPQAADFRMVKFSGEATHDRFNFTQCHSFGVETAISFNAPDAPGEPARFAVSANDDVLRPLPAGLEIPVKLTTRLSGGMTVGTLIDGVVPGNVMLMGQTAIPAGSPVRGRIRRLERSTDPEPYFTIAIEYTEVAFGGVRYRFDAALSRMDPAPGVEQELLFGGSSDMRASVRGGITSRQTVHFTELPGVATFFCRGARLNIADGFQTVWNTARKQPMAGHR